jgi:translation elongation factor EF-G
MQVTPCLFINKIDRLILELKFTPAEVREHMRQASLFARQILASRS